MKIICLTGMPGSGKSIIANIAREMGIPVLVMGDVVREEAEKRGIELTPNSLTKLALQLRLEYGPQIIAQRIVEKVKRLYSGHSVVLIDGVRSLEEIEYFRKNIENSTVIVIAIHSSPKTRFKRLLCRGRPGDPKSWSEFTLRDKRELEIGVGNVIALADYIIVNEGNIDEFLHKAKLLLEKVVRNG